jgi:hypothetical protein
MEIGRLAKPDHLHGAVHCLTLGRRQKGLFLCGSNQLAHGFSFVQVLRQWYQKFFGAHEAG